MQVIDAMLQIADSTFQPGLMAQAKRARKLTDDYRLPSETDNSPQALQEIFNRQELRPYFPEYPLGTDLTATEQELVRALQWLQINTARTSSRLRVMILALLSSGAPGNDVALDRLGLGQASGIGERLTRRLVGYALNRTGK